MGMGKRELLDSVASADGAREDSFHEVFYDILEIISISPIYPDLQAEFPLCVNDYSQDSEQIVRLNARQTYILRQGDVGVVKLCWAPERW